MTNDPLEIRDLRFELAAIPRYWHGGRRSVTLFLNNLSLLFPAGERFFIASVRAQLGSVKDADLLLEMKAFTAQEGVHSREHMAYNRMVEAHGYPAAAMARWVERLLAGTKAARPPVAQLAVTCALEHFTAMLGDMLLANPKLLEGADPTMAALWRWHAAEENEHKAVAFDVYRAVGGSYVQRVASMLLATLVFWGVVLIQQVRLMWADGCLFSLVEWGRLFRHVFLDPGRMGALLWPYLAYFSPRFHPWNHDNRALLDAWKAEFRGSPIYERAANRAL
jgi:predicted metal-dependent hydrolase